MFPQPPHICSSPPSSLPPSFPPLPLSLPSPALPLARLTHQPHLFLHGVLKVTWPDRHGGEHEAVPRAGQVDQPTAAVALGVTVGGWWLESQATWLAWGAQVHGRELVESGWTLYGYGCNGRTNMLRPHSLTHSLTLGSSTSRGVGANMPEPLLPQMYIWSPESATAVT